MFKDYTLQTTWKRVLVAVAIGAFVATAIVDSYGWIKSNIEFDGMFGYSRFFNDFDTALMFVIALATPLIGWGLLGVFFLPFLFLLNKFGYGTWLSLLLFGFVITVIILFVGFTNFLTGIRDMPEHANQMPFLNNDPHWDNTTLTALGWKRAALKAVVMGVVGAVEAFTIWRIAYRRPPPC